MPELSIIVPVYRAEAFLHKCAESILSQTFGDLELILVDDGSPDRSGEICDEIARKDSRVQVIHEKNSGVGAARNRGLEAAGGKWIGFVDSDDWVDSGMYSRMLQQAFDADVVMCDFMTVYEDGRREPDSIRQLPQTILLTHGDFHPRLLMEFAQSACRCIYRRKLLQDNNIRFPEGLKLSEDRVFNFYAMGRAKSILYLKEPLYMRFVNLESCVNTYHPDYAVQGKRAAEETRKALAAAWNDDPVYQEAFLGQYAGTFINQLVLLQWNQKQCRLSFFKRLQEVRKICRNSDFRALLKKGVTQDRVGRLALRNRYLTLIFCDCWLDRKIQNVGEQFRENGISGVIRKTLGKFTGKA